MYLFLMMWQPVGSTPAGLAGVTPFMDWNYWRFLYNAGQPDYRVRVFQVVSRFPT